MFINPGFPDSTHRHDNQPSATGQHHQNRLDRHTGNASEKLLMQLAKKVPGLATTEDIETLASNNFSPSKVADRISDLVAEGLENARRAGKSATEIEALHDQAVLGIKKGFQEAREVLDDLDLLTEATAKTINETLKLTIGGLEGLAAQENPAPAAAPDNVRMAANERYRSAEAFSLDVLTQDGDKVTIRFGSENSYESKFGAHSDGRGTAATFSFDASAKSHYGFSVEGSLDEGEIDALQGLIGSINNIAADFFDGDVQSAFEQAADLRMDKTELSFMHLKLTQTENYSAASAYQQVQNQSSPSSRQGLKLGHIFNDFAGQTAKPGLNFLNSPFEVGKESLSNLIHQDARYKEQEDDAQSLIDRNLDVMNQFLDKLAAT